MSRRAHSAAAVLLALLCPSCSEWQSTFNVAGPQAANLAQLMQIIMAVCALIWIAVVAVLVRAIWRAHEARLDPLALDGRRERRSIFVVSGAVALTIVVIGAFTLMSYLATRSLASAARQPISIQVRGHQWWWEVTYRNPDPGQDFTTANEIHIPVGRPVRIELNADDVIHSFWVPSLAGKQDLIPGRDNQLTFTAMRAGVYRGQCAEFCGLQHARMAILVIAEPPAQFEAWRQAQLRPAVASADQTGLQLFESKGCGGCHTVRGTEAAGRNGPDLTHVASRRYIAAGTLESTRGGFAAWIADPQTVKPGNNMPMVSLTGDELNAVSGYMAGLK